ncbi:hypothetical protein KSP35_21685 [Aquihabitans sp. G128]|uniref:hypothetical protein n=1 Tax=Aquihabitans sp. G128 TaxID=2849779 RepID=UPI001C23AF14|nr:hypothetical protein [Aquihabitans sp. G128]QXC60898.1 hypothetical protein KSP35_21685 [Aquihabitans sp. G128]
MAVIVVLLVLALIFGLGAVLKGLLWLALIAVALIVAAGFLGRAALSARRA